MSLLTLPSKVADIKRLRSILTLVSEAGFAYAISQARLSHLIFWHHRALGFLRSREERGAEHDAFAPARLRILLIKLGPTFIKLGQMLSVRSDILPPAFQIELARLTNQVPPFPFPQARAIIERELGETLPVLFAEFDQKPIGAASLAQVYRAKLFSGERVAVKVQRPGIRPTVEQDINLLRYLAQWIERHAPEWEGYRPVALADEFTGALERELDFTTEASHAKRFAQMFRGSETVKIARIFDDYSTSCVLTMELIEGAPVEDAARLRERGLDPTAVARNGAHAMLRQIFVEGFFHADPHSGNYFALPNNVFAFIDYGLIGRLSTRERWELSAFFLALLHQDSETAIRHLRRLSKTSRSSNVTAFENDVDDILYGWFGGDLRQIRLGQAFARVLESGRKNGVYFPSSLALLAKSLYTTEAMGRALDPKFDLTALFQNFAVELLESRLNLKKIRDEAQDRAFDALTYSEILPEETLRLLTRLSEGELQISIDEAQLRQFEDAFAAQGMKRLGAAFMAVMVFVAAVGYGARTFFSRD